MKGLGVFRRLPLALTIFGMAQYASAGVWRSSGPPGRVSALAVDPRSSSVAYSAIFEYPGEVRPRRAVYKTLDGGRSWAFTGLTDHLISELVVTPSGVVYAGGHEAPDFKSLDEGQTWQEIRPRHPGTAVVFYRLVPTMPETIYASIAYLATIGGDPGGELLKTTDGGSTWVNIQTPSTGLERGTLGDVILDPSRPSILYATVRARGLYRSFDAGITWHRVADLLPTEDWTTLEIDPLVPQVIYAGSGAGVFKSENSGGTFRRVGVGLPSAGVWDLQINPRQPSTIYAATRGAGVYESRDGGLTWSSISAGLSNLMVFQLAIDSAATTLHVATSDGVFEYDLTSADFLLPLSGQRFVASLSARDPRTGRSGSGIAKQLGALAGFFAIPTVTGSLESPEVFVKVVDGRAINGRFWVFYGGLTDLEYTLTVTEEETGRVKTYFKPAGSACGGIDTEAFGP